MLSDRRHLANGTCQNEPRMTFYVNEEGKIHHLPVNRLGTAIWWHYTPHMVGQDVLCGPVVILGYPVDDGEDTSVPTDVAKVYAAVLTRGYPTPSA